MRFGVLAPVFGAIAVDIEWRRVTKEAALAQIAPNRQGMAYQGSRVGFGGLLATRATEQ